MHQVLFRILPFHLGSHWIAGFPIYTYGVFLSIAFAVSLFVAVKRAKAQGVSPEMIADLSIILLVVGVIGARLLFVAEEWGEYSENPWSIFNVREGGLSLHGGLIAAFLAGWWIARRRKMPFWRTADILAPAIAIGMGIGRIGCFFNGCCLGTPTRLPWGVVFKDNPGYFGPRHPTQLYEMALDFLIAGILIFGFKHTRPGVSFLWLCVLAGFSRFMIEFLRADAIPIGLLSLVQWITLFIMGLAALYLVKLNRPVPDRP